MNVSILVLAFEVDIADRVNNKDLAVLSHDPLATPGRASGTLSRSRGRCALRLEGLLPATTTALLLRLLLLHAPLSAVGRLRQAVFFLDRRRSRHGLCIDTRDATVSTPGSVPREPDVPSDELGLPLPAHVQREIVDSTTTNQEHTNEDRAKAGAVPVVVVVGTLPQREAVRDEVVVAVAARPTKNVGNQGKARLTVRRLLHSLLDHGSRGGLGGAILLGGFGVLGSDLLGDLVGVKRAGLLAVGFVDVVLRR